MNKADISKRYKLNLYVMIAINELSSYYLKVTDNVVCRYDVTFYLDIYTAAAVDSNR